jgi:hypothetical protein
MPRWSALKFVAFSAGLSLTGCCAYSTDGSGTVTEYGIINPNYNPLGTPVIGSNPENPRCIRFGTSHLLPCMQ